MSVGDVSARATRRRPSPWALAVVLVVLVVLALSVSSYRLIPGWSSPWGLDLQNVWAFHHCSARDDPYGVPGSACGDLYGRPIPYPPLLYWSFLWTRAVSFTAARWIWAAVGLAILLASAVLWARARSADERSPSSRTSTDADAIAAIFGALLATQFPAVFAIERGNNDVLVLLVWTASSMLFLRGRPALAGLLAGAAAILKVYPAFAVVVVVAGATGMLARGPRSSRVTALRFGAALVVAPVVVTLAFLHQTRVYVRDVLPPFAAHLPGVTVHSHSVPATLPSPRVWSAAVILAWCVAAFARMKDAPRDVLAGALAVSTFVAATSFDYNLVTTYPLLVVQMHGVLSHAPPGFAQVGRHVAASSVVLGLGLVAIVLHRSLFVGFPVARVALQVAWLVASAALVLARRGDA